MAISKEHLRHILLYEFDRRTSPTQAYQNIIDTYGKDSVKLNTCYNWHRKFLNGDSSIKDKPKSGRKVTTDSQIFLDLIQQDPTQSLKTLAQKCNTSKSTISRHFKKIGMRYHNGRWTKYSIKNQKETSVENSNPVNDS